MTATTTHITGIRTVSIPVGDQDAALRFYSGTLGFTVLRDNPTPNGGRWIELAPGGDNAIVTLEPAAPDVTRGAIGIRFTTDDAEAAHAALLAAGSTSTRSCAGPACPPCSPSATPRATPSPSPKRHRRASTRELAISCDDRRVDRGGQGTSATKETTPLGPHRHSDRSGAGG